MARVDLAHLSTPQQKQVRQNGKAARGLQMGR